MKGFFITKHWQLRKNTDKMNMAGIRTPWQGCGYNRKDKMSCKYKLTGRDENN